MERLKDKIIAITGAGSGIGKTAAKMFAAENATVLVLELNEASAKQTVAEIEAAGSKLLAMGADHRYVMRTMQDKTLDDLIRQGEILRRVKRVMEGKVAYVYMSYQEAKKLHISYEDIHPISGMLRDCEDIEMGFSMYEEAPNIWRCSFRSDGQWINVNEMMKSFGGGGHAAAAGLRRETDQPEVLLEQLLAQIESIQSLG